MQDTLGFPDKADQRAEPGTGWTPAVLHHVLYAHVVIVVDSGHGAWTSFERNGSRSCSGGSIVTMGGIECQMVSLQSAKEAIPFPQPID
jgi:hypothetical protein